MMEKEKKEIVKIARKMAEKGVLFGSWGNLSILNGRHMAITPSAMRYENMKPSDVAVIDLSGRQAEGKEKSTEWRMHAEIYRTSGHRAVVHVHSPYASAFGVARRPVKCRTEDAVQLIGDIIPVTPYFLTGTRKLAFAVAEAMEKKRSNAAIMANHGLVAAGRTLYEAWLTALVAEKTCMVEILGRCAGRPRDIPKRERIQLKEKFVQYAKSLFNLKM